ncbi:MAG: hypothetical protein R2876_05610 [Eubacteriales bacterium]
MKTKKQKIILYSLKTAYFLSGLLAVIFLLIFLIRLFLRNMLNNIYLSFLNLSLLCTFITISLVYLEYRIKLFLITGIFSIAQIDKKLEVEFFQQLSKLTDKDYKNKLADEFSSTDSRFEKIKILDSIKDKLKD